jgi:hypothetical protein
MGPTTIAAHVAARIGVALWRQRITLLLVAGALVGLTVYELGFAGPATPASLDCADTAMNAVAQVDDQAARAAYQCLGDEMRISGEQQFVDSLHDRGDVPKGRISRVADHRTADGGRIVFYTVEAAGQAVGYIVYLDSAGLVQKIE